MPSGATNGVPLIEDLQVLQAMAGLAASEGAPASVADLSTLGGALPVGETAEDEASGTYEDQPQPGSSAADEVELTEEQLGELGRACKEKIDLFRDGVKGVHERWREIEDAYHLKPSGETYRSGVGEQLVSPLLMMMVDQAAARVEGGLLEAEPLVRVRPIHGLAASQVALEEEAGSAERFFNNYLKTSVRITRRLVPALRRWAKLGTAVLRWDWQDRTRKVRFYTKGGELHEEAEQTSRLTFDVLPNEEIVLWPLDAIDWQEDAEIVGHRAYYGATSWARKAAELGLSPEDADAILRRTTAVPPEKNENLSRQGVDAETADAQYPPVALTELWCHMTLPGGSEPERFVVLMEEETPKILRVTWNTHHQQKHPYYPLRYKIVDGWAWGHGIGHEILPSQTAKSALKSLKYDNLAAGAYWVNLVRMGSLAHQVKDAIYPGAEIAVEHVDGPDADFKPVKMGGEAPEIDAAEAAEDYEGRAAVGLPDVLQGMGDARLKSGGSTGQTLALIEQASVKFNSTGRTTKDDFGDFLRAGFEYLCQYAPDGLITRFADEEDELVVRSLRWTPPRGRSIAEAFEIWVEAPSMATSNESRKERGLMLSEFMGRQVQLLQPIALELLAQENPAAATRYLRAVYDFFSELSKRIVRYHDMPGLEQRFPELPEPIPEDQIINQLQQAVAEAQGQVEQLSAENQALMDNIAQGLHHEQAPEGLPS